MLALLQAAKKKQKEKFRIKYFAFWKRDDEKFVSSFMFHHHRIKFQEPSTKPKMQNYMVILTKRYRFYDGIY